MASPASPQTSCWPDWECQPHRNCTFCTCQICTPAQPPPSLPRRPLYWVSRRHFHLVSRVPATEIAPLPTELCSCLPALHFGTSGLYWWIFFCGCSSRLPPQSPLGSTPGSIALNIATPARLQTLMCLNWRIHQVSGSSRPQVLQTVFSLWYCRIVPSLLSLFRHLPTCPWG